MDLDPVAEHVGEVGQEMEAAQAAQIANPAEPERAVLPRRVRAGTRAEFAGGRKPVLHQVMAVLARMVDFEMVLEEAG